MCVCVCMRVRTCKRQWSALCHRFALNVYEQLKMKLFMVCASFSKTPSISITAHKFPLPIFIGKTFERWVPLYTAVVFKSRHNFYQLCFLSHIEFRIYAWVCGKIVRVCSFTLILLLVLLNFIFRPNNTTK